MISFKNISGLLLVIAFAVYLVFGNPDNLYWGSYYFCVWNLVIIYLGRLLLKPYRDKLIRIAVKIILGVSSVNLVLNIYSFFDIEVFNKINRSYEAGAFIVGCILIFIIYGKHERLVKR